MESNNKVLVVALLVVVAAVALIFSQPMIQERIAPDIKTAWVAVEVEGATEGGLAEIGPVEIEAGAKFRLHAVVEARDDDGVPTYYTEAKALRVGGEDVPAKRIRRWNRPGKVMVRWFTIEGTPPYLEAISVEEFERFSIQELYRSEWPLNWSVPGMVEPAQDDHLAATDTWLFGIQRYRVSIEVYYPGNEILPGRRIRSWGPDDLPGNADFPTVTAVLPGRLEAVSRIFGLSQIEVPGDPPQEVRDQVQALLDQRLAFSRLTVLRDHLQGAGKSLGDLVWREVDLVAEASPWGEPGDFLRAGERIVVLYEDQGVQGFFDYEDLAIDLERGVGIRPLGEIFSGDGEGLVETASLGP